jgi:hypothetical protein
MVIVDSFWVVSVGLLIPGSASPDFDGRVSAAGDEKWNVVVR